MIKNKIKMNSLDEFLFFSSFFFLVSIEKSVSDTIFWGMKKYNVEGVRWGREGTMTQNSFREYIA